MALSSSSSSQAIRFFVPVQPLSDFLQKPFLVHIFRLQRILYDAPLGVPASSAQINLTQLGLLTVALTCVSVDV